MPYGKHGRAGRPPRRGRVFRDSTERRRRTAYYNNRRRSSPAVNSNTYDDQEIRNQAEMQNFQENQDAGMTDIDAPLKSELSQLSRKPSGESVSKPYGTEIFDKVKEKEVKIVLKRIDQDIDEYFQPKTSKAPVQKQLEFMIPKVAKRSGLTKLDNVVPRVMNFGVATRSKSSVLSALRPKEACAQHTVLKSSPPTKLMNPGLTLKPLFVRVKQPISIASASNSQVKSSTLQALKKNSELSAPQSSNPAATNLPEKTSTVSVSTSVTSAIVSQNLKLSDCVSVAANTQHEINSSRVSENIIGRCMEKSSGPTIVAISRREEVTTLTASSVDPTELIGSVTPMSKSQDKSVSAAINTQPETNSSQVSKNLTERCMQKSSGSKAVAISRCLEVKTSTASSLESIEITGSIPPACVPQDQRSVGPPSSSSILSERQSISRKNCKRKWESSTAQHRQEALKKICSDLHLKNSRLQSGETHSEVLTSKSLESVITETTPLEVTNNADLVSKGLNCKIPSRTRCYVFHSFNASSLPIKVGPDSTSLQPNNKEKCNFFPNLNTSTTAALPSTKDKAPTNGTENLVHSLKNQWKSVKVLIPRIGVLKPATTSCVSPASNLSSSGSTETNSVTKVVKVNVVTKMISLSRSDSNPSNLSSPKPRSDSNPSNLNSSKPLPDTSERNRPVIWKARKSVKNGQANHLKMSCMNKQFNGKQSLITVEKCGNVVNGHSQMSHQILCLSIQIGSYKIHPTDCSSHVSVDITPGSFFFQVPSTKTPFDLVPITLKMPDIVQVLVNFSRTLPVIFVMTTSTWAASTRDQLGMVNRGPIYFDPKSEDEKQKRITFLIGVMDKKLQEYLNYAFPGKISKLKQKEANQMLLSCTPKQIKVIEMKLREQKRHEDKEHKLSVSQDDESKEKSDCAKNHDGSDSISTDSGDETSGAENSVFLCTFCMKTFDDRLECKKHLKIHPEKYICQICSKSFPSKHDLYVHMAECQVDQNALVCSVCMMEFSQACDLNQHMKFHYSNTPFECEICKLSFSQQKSLASHAYQSHNENLYQCRICKTFRFKDSHHQHMRSHSNKRLFVCKTCSQVFTRQLMLKIHNHRIHKQKKKTILHCSVCRKLFFQLRLLKEHIRREHPDKCKNKKAARNVSKSSPGSSITQQKQEKSVSALASGRRKNSAKKLNRRVQVQEKCKVQEQTEVSVPQSTVEAQVQQTSQRQKKKQVSPQRSIVRTKVQKTNKRKKKKQALPHQLSVGTEVRKIKKRKEIMFPSPQKLTVAPVRKTYEKLKNPQVSSMQLAIEAQIERTHLTHMEKPVDSVAVANIQPESNESRTMGTVPDRYVLNSSHLTAAAVTNFPEVAKTSTPMTVCEAESVKSAHCTALDVLQPSWLVGTCTDACSKNVTPPQTCKTYSKADRLNLDGSSVYSSAIFVSSFEVEPEEDVASLFDESFADPVLSPSKLQKELHQDAQPLSWLIGRWKSITAVASYPDMKVEPCRGEMCFLSTMPHLLQYNSESRHVKTGKLMFCESGFLNTDLSSKMVAFMVTHSLGVSEMSEGTLCDKTMLTLSSKSIAHMSFTTNASVTEIVRSFELKGDILTSIVSMATASQPLQTHSVAKYQKVL